MRFPAGSRVQPAPGPEDLRGGLPLVPIAPEPLDESREVVDHQHEVRASGWPTPSRSERWTWLVASIVNHAPAGSVPAGLRDRSQAQHVAIERGDRLRVAGVTGHVDVVQSGHASTL